MTELRFTGKVELFPGSYQNGSNFEADLMREKHQLMVSGAFSQNNNALRSQVN
jgi:hypothetical protein